MASSLYMECRHGDGAQLERVLEEWVRERLGRVGSPPTFHFRCTAAARKLLLRDGADRKYGARDLQRAIERRLVQPLANLIATRQILPQDLLVVDVDETGTALALAREQAARHRG